MIPFEIVMHSVAPIAILVRNVKPLDPAQIKFLYSLIPAFSFNNALLAKRWKYDLVACPPNWATDQLSRVPCTKPKNTIRLSFQ